MQEASTIGKLGCARTRLQVAIDALAGAVLAEAVRAHLEGRLRLVAQRAQHVCGPQAAASQAQVPTLQRAAHAPIVQDAIAHLQAAGRPQLARLKALSNMGFSRVDAAQVSPGITVTEPRHGEEGLKSYKQE